MRQSVREIKRASAGNRVLATLFVLALALIVGSGIFSTVRSESTSTIKVPVVEPAEQTEPTAGMATTRNEVGIAAEFGLISAWLIGLGVVVTKARRRGQPQPLGAEPE